MCRKAQAGEPGLVSGGVLIVMPSPQNRAQATKALLADQAAFMKLDCGSHER
jgi:hypothetical protein